MNPPFISVNEYLNSINESLIIKYVTIAPSQNLPARQNAHQYMISVRLRLDFRNYQG
ncbi:hypothetical protein [Nostoc sp.]|uniref:hypothetical protein n=1 Tax=Nostoc sp. TaxID=1180 RepID=UPI002FF56EB7